MTYLALKPLLNSVALESREFYEGVLDLFLGVKEGHLGRYCFSEPLSETDPVRGDEYWADFIATTKDYYMYHDEAALIQIWAHEIGSLVGNAKTFVDLGAGSLQSFEKKVLPILRSCKPFRFIFVDACSTFAELGKEFLKKKNIPATTSLFICDNFFETLPNLEDKAVINLQGSTLGNCIVDLNHETTEQGLERTLRYFAKALMPNGGYFLVTYDTNQDEKSIVIPYDHPSYHEMEMTILRRVLRDLPTSGFDPNDFEHVTVWHHHWHLAAQAVRAKRAVHFRIGAHEIRLAAGQSLRTGSSFKFPEVMMQRAARNAGFEHLHTFTLPGSTMRLAVLKAAV